MRDRALYRARSTEAYLHDDELESACHVLRTAADLARRTGSVRVLETIRRVRLGMSPYDHETPVRDLDDHLRALETQPASL